MSPEQFVYWLQGYSELNGQRPTVEAWQSIQAHLNLVLKKVTPEAKKEKQVSIGDFIVNQTGKLPEESITTLPYIPPVYQPYPQPADNGKFWMKDSHISTTLTC